MTTRTFKQMRDQPLWAATFNASLVPVVKGHKSLLEIASVVLSEEDESPFRTLVRAVAAKPLGMSRQFVEGDPLASIRTFFDHIGAVWTEFLDPEGPRELKEPAGMVYAVAAALFASGVASGLPSSHPAFATLIALSVGSEIQFAPNPRKKAAEIVKAYTVSFVDQGQDAIREATGEKVAKEELRLIVQPILSRHFGWLLPKGGPGSGDALRAWETGRDTAPAKKVALNLLPMTVHQYRIEVERTLATLGQVFRPLLDGHRET